MSELEKQINAVHRELVEQGGFTCLPGMNDRDFDHCQCGLGWPMGSHHEWTCPAHCICGMVKMGSTKKMTCAYHGGETSHVPVGPSVMTERWDLPENERHELQIVEDDTSGEIPSRSESKATSGPPSLSHMRWLPK